MSPERPGAGTSYAVHQRRYRMIMTPAEHVEHVGMTSRHDRLVFDSSDLARTEAFLSASYAPMRIGSSTGKGGAHITRVAAGTTSTDQLDLSFEMSYDVSPLGKICLCDIEAGTVEGHQVEDWRQPEAFGAGEVFSFSPPDRAYRGRICQARYTITMFDPALLDQVAGTEVRLLDHRPHDSAAVKQVRAAIAHLRDNVLGVPGPGDNELVLSTAFQYLAASVLHAFPTTAPAERGVDRRDAHDRTLRRAIAFIEANAGRDISVADIAAAAGVSVRTIQLAFRRHLGTTSTAYLRRVRLDQAHAELRAATPGDVTVDQVAARWGYARTGEFADHYRAAYGESPAGTLDGETVRAPRTIGPDPLVTQLEALVATLRTAATVDEALRHIADATRKMIPGAGLVRVTPAAGGAPAVHSDGADADLDLVQHHAAVLSVDLPGEQQGTFTVYSRLPDGFRDADRAVATLMAAHCALAITRADAVREADVQRTQLMQAIGSRDLIGQAKGILMHKESLTAEEAFELLRRTSQDHNVKLVDLARTLTTRHSELDLPR